MYRYEKHLIKRLPYLDHTDVMITDGHCHNNMTGQGTYERCGVEQPAPAQDPLLVACGKQILESDNS